MDEAQSNRLYESRLARLQKLANMNAPKDIIARECLLVATMVLSKDQTTQGLVTYILTEFGNKEGN